MKYFCRLFCITFLTSVVFLLRCQAKDSYPVCFARFKKALKKGRVLLKTMENYPNQWHYWVGQMKDPINTRQQRKLKKIAAASSKVEYKYGPDGVYRKVDPYRVSPRKGTQKNSTSLLHSTGKVSSVFCSRHNLQNIKVGLLFYSPDCYIDDNYCFAQDASTKLPRWWKVEFSPGEELLHTWKLATRNHYNNNFILYGQKPFSKFQHDAIHGHCLNYGYTEILASFTKESVLGVFVLEDSYWCDDLKKKKQLEIAELRQSYLQKQLGISVPIIRLSCDNEPEIVLNPEK